jgi:hypothetical protein
VEHVSFDAAPHPTDKHPVHSFANLPTRHQAAPRPSIDESALTRAITSFTLPRTHAKTNTMALISARTILTSVSLFHITLGFFFLTSPVTVADQALVYVMGEAMGMPYSRSFEAKSAPLAFLAVVLATVGITDLVTLSLPEEVCLVHHWGSQGKHPSPFFKSPRGPIASCKQASAS